MSASAWDWEEISKMEGNAPAAEAREFLTLSEAELPFDLRK